MLWHRHFSRISLTWPVSDGIFGAKPAIVLATLVEALAHDHPSDKDRHTSLDELYRLLADSGRELALESPYALEVQSHIVDILKAYRVFRNRFDNTRGSSLSVLLRCY